MQPLQVSSQRWKLPRACRGAGDAFVKTVHDDSDLRALASTPDALLCSRSPIGEAPRRTLLPPSSLGSKQRAVFATYVQRMLHPSQYPSTRSPPTDPPLAQPSGRQIKRQNQTVFYLEQMQADWLSGSRMLGVHRVVGHPAARACSWASSSLSPSLLVFGLLPADLCVVSIFWVGSLEDCLEWGSATQRPETDGTGRPGTVPWRQSLQRLLIGILIGLGSVLNYGLLDGPRVGLINGLTSDSVGVLLQFLFVKRNAATVVTPSTPLNVANEVAAPISQEYMATQLAACWAPGWAELGLERLAAPRTEWCTVLRAEHGADRRAQWWTPRPADRQEQDSPVTNNSSGRGRDWTESVVVAVGIANDLAGRGSQRADRRAERRAAQRAERPVDLLGYASRLSSGLGYWLCSGSFRGYQ